MTSRVPRQILVLFAAAMRIYPLAQYSAGTSAWSSTGFATSRSRSVCLNH